MFTPLPSFAHFSGPKYRSNHAAAILPRRRREIQSTTATRRRGGCVPPRLEVTRYGDALPHILYRGGKFRQDSRRQRVRAACLELLEQGGYPTLRWLVEHFPGVNARSLQSYRNSLLLEIQAAARSAMIGPGLIGNTPEERAEIEARIAHVRDEKMARGEASVCALVWEVPRTRALREFFKNRPDEVGDNF
jgi:hypothetical protein